MKPAVLDSSAVIALLMAEPGQEAVQARLPDALISSVNLAEVVSYFARRGAKREAIVALVDSISIKVVAFEAELAATTGMLIAHTRSTGLSLGDCACLALAATRRADALTADRAWLKLGAAAGAEVVVIR